ncbi:MAG: alpha/beta fold hydrolase [Sphaerobacter sp.]|nr:alpha/beta fold hydrolase [Sphaerobacter sp.]
MTHRRMARWWRRARLALLVVVLLAAGVLGGVGWVGSERALHPEPAVYPWTLAAFPELRAEPVVFQSRTGIPIAGRLFRGTNGATIVLSHGYGDHQDQLLPWAAFLNRAGFTVFTYDMRNRGSSGGDDVTLGALEQEDLLSAIDYLASRPDIDATRIGALGVSLGGAVSIMAAAQDSRIRAVVDDCGFSDAPTVIETGFEHFLGIPAFPFAPITVWIAEQRAGVTIDTVRPGDVVARLSPRPLLIIHGTADPVVPVAHSERLFAAAREPKELWLVPGAGHNESRVVAGSAYEQRVVDFFRAHLTGGAMVDPARRLVLLGVSP